MATIIKSKSQNSVKKNYKKYLAGWIAKWAGTAVGAGAAIATVIFGIQKNWSNVWISAALLAAGGMFALIMRKKTYHGMRIFRSGYLGEKRTTSFLKKLSDDFVVLPDVVLAKNIQIDHLILCPAGIVVLEVKNYRGVIHLKNRKAPMLHSKQTKAGIVYENEAANPAEQAMRLESILRGMRKGWGYARLPIKGAVYFANPHVVVENKAAYPVFTYRKRSKLLKFFGDFLKEDAKLTHKEMMRLARRIRQADAYTERLAGHSG